MAFRGGSSFWIFAVVLIVGCGASTDVSRDDLEKMVGGQLKEVVAVTGKVLIDGEAKGGVNLYLYKPDGTPMPNGARTNSDGTYCWTTYGVCDGLEAGDYVICFRYIPIQIDNDKGDAVESDLLGGKYNDPSKSEFKLTVVKGAPQENVDYDLKMK